MDSAAPARVTRDRCRRSGFEGSIRRFIALQLLAITLVSGWLPLRAGQPSIWSGQVLRPVPPGARVTLELDRDAFFLGENVLVHLVLENTGDEAFEFSWGGDYRGAGRALRFKVTATDEAGRAAEDPDPSPMCMGGIGGTTTLEPGSRFVASLPLMRYREIDTPGVYTIRATHDFGWTEGERKHPVGEIKARFRTPGPADAEKVIVRMESLPADPGARWGERSPEYADFGCVRHPAYLEPLVRRIRAGDRRGLKGIGGMTTPESTQALIQLAAEAEADLGLEVAQTLLHRLPHAGLDSSPPPAGQYDRFAVRRRLVERTWAPRFSGDVRDLAGTLLARGEVGHVSLGARFVEAVGTREDAPAVLAALDRALAGTTNPRKDPKDNILDFPQPTRELLDAMQALRLRGFALGEDLSGAAQILVCFHQLAGEPAPRSGRWLQLLDAFGAAGQYPLREAAIRSIPDPVPPEFIEFIRRGLDDPDLGVCRAACSVAGRSGSSEFIQPLLDIIATENHEWLLREATNAAQSLRAGPRLLHAWADRLGDERLYVLALDALQTVLEVPGSSSGRTDLGRAGRLELQKAWRAFLADHAEEIAAGRRFPLSDPAVKPALVGQARSWQLSDGTSWPPMAQSRAAD